LGSTARFGLTYPALTDAPNGPVQIQALADGVDGQLARAFRCTSSTRPSGVPNDFLIRESDTGNVLIWSGSAWEQVNGAATGGGGGGGTTTVATVSATYAATSAQSIAASQDVVVAFGVEQVADPLITRSTSGAGHQFTLAQTRLWIVTATVRFAQNPLGGRTFEIVTSSGAVLTKASGPQNQDAPWSASLSVARRLPAGTRVMVRARHNSTTSLLLEPSGGDYCHIDIAGI
jgi:hypothetical protein